MAGNTIATAWIQVLPSLDGLQAALVRASAGAVLTPKVQPAASSGKLFNTAGKTFASLFNSSFGKNTQTGIRSAFQASLSRITSQFQSSGSASGKSFNAALRKYFGNDGISSYLKIGAAVASVGSLTAAFTGLGSTIVSIGNQWGQTTAMIKNAVGDTEDWRQALESTLDSANDVGVTVKDMAETSARLVTLAPNTIPDYETAVKFSSLLSKDMIATGASTQETNSAMRQITQALGKGVVNGDELTSIMENAPQIAQFLADELGVSVGELKELGKEGNISGDALRDAVLNNADEINKQFAAMPITADRAFNQIVNDLNVRMSDAAVKISQSLGKGLTAISTSGIADSIGKGLEGLVPLAESIGNAMANVANQFAPAIEKAFDPDNVSGFVQPLTDMFDKLSQMSFDDMMSAIQQFGTIATIAFIAVNGGVDGLIGRIPIVGQKLLSAKNTLVDLTAAGGAAFGEIVDATGRGINGLGRFVESLGDVFDKMDESNRATTEFRNTIEKLDFSALGSAGDGIRQVADDMNRGVVSIKQGVQQINDGLQDVDTSKLPKGFDEAFEKIQNIASKQGNGIVNDVRSMVTRSQTIIGELSETAASLRISVQLNEGTTRSTAAELRSYLTSLVSEVTGIHIPDFLSPAIGSMVATSVNEINAIIDAARRVGTTAGSLLAAGLKSAGFNADGFKTQFDSIANMAKTTASNIASAFSDNRFTSGVTRMVSEFSAKFPRISQVAKSSMNIVSDSVDAVRTHFGSLSNAAQTAFSKMASAASKVAGKSIKGIGSALSGVSGAFAGLGRMAGSLGITGALFTGLAAGVTALWNTDPAQLGDTFDTALAQMTAGLEKAQTQLPAMASALSDALPDIVSTVVEMLPGLASAFGQVVFTLASALKDNMPALLAGFSTMFDGLVQQIPTVLPQLINGFALLFDSIAANLPGMVIGLSNAFILAIQAIGQALPTALPTIMSGFTGLFNGVAAQLPSLTQNIANAIPTLVNGLASALTTSAPSLINGVAGLVTTIAAQLPTLLPVVAQGIVTLVSSLVAQLPTLVQAIVTAIPMILTSIVQAIVAATPVVVNGLVSLITQIAAELPSLIQTVIDAVPTLIGQVLPAIAEAAPQIVEGVTTVITTLVAELPSIFQTFIAAIPQLIVTVADTIISNAPTIIGGFGQAIISLAAALPGLFVSVIAVIPSIVVSIASGFAGLGAKILGHIKDIPSKIKGLFSGAGSWLINAGKSIINGFLNGLKSAWSGVTDFVSGIGDWIVEHKGPLSYDRRMLIPAGKAIMGSLGDGLKTGFEQEVRPFIDSVSTELSDGLNVTAGVKVERTMSSRYAGSAYDAFQNGGYTGVTIEKVEASPLSDVDLVARRFGYALDRQMIGSVRP